MKEGESDGRDSGTKSRNNREVKEGPTSSCFVSAAVGNKMHQTEKQTQKEGVRKIKISDNFGGEKEEMNSCKGSK